MHVKVFWWSQDAGAMILPNDLFAVPPVENVGNAAIAGAIAGGIVGAVLIFLCVGGMLIGWLYDRRRKHIGELQRLDILSRYIIVSCPARARLPARSSLVNKVLSWA